MGLVAGVVSARFEGAATAEMKEAGRELFVRQWVAHDPQAHGDGLGPVFNANSCVACHSQGGVGGGGDAAHNVVAYEVHPTVRDRKMQKGLVHAFAINQTFVESRALLKNTFPITTNVCAGSAPRLHNRSASLGQNALPPGSLGRRRIAA